MSKVKKNITVLKGDGIGPEIVTEAIKVLEAVAGKYGYEFVFDDALIGAIAIDRTGSALPEETVEKCKKSDAVLLGAVGDPKYDNNPKAKVRPEQGLLGIRKALGLFCNIRPIQVFDRLIDMSPIRPERVKGSDFVIYRELTGGSYFGEKGRLDGGNTAFDNCLYSRGEIERIAHLAFRAAGQRRGKLTLIDKANVQETSRLWREVIQDLAAQYPAVTVDYLFVDNAAMQIILNPAQFDVVLTENMFGDIISDEASVLSGSLGMLSSASIGESTALFEPSHGSYPQAAGKNIANPMATILSAAMMLDHFGLVDGANDIRRAVDCALNDGYTTVDISKENPKSTSEVGSYIASLI